MVYIYIYIRVILSISIDHRAVRIELICRSARDRDEYKDLRDRLLVFSLSFLHLLLRPLCVYYEAFGSSI